MVESVLGFLKMNDVQYEENRLLSELSSVAIGAHARAVAYPKSMDELCKTVNFLEKSQIRHKLVGRMTNTLPPDDVFEGVIVKTDKISDVTIQGNVIYAGAGVSLPALANKAANSGLSGLEELSGIPGSLGGAIYGNAGAFGRDISDLILSVICYNVRTNKIIALNNAECDFAYRHSTFKESDLLIVYAQLGLIKSDSETVKSKILLIKEKRARTQPVGKKSLGSVFKRTKEGESAAFYIDKCGLKGYTVGGAQISEKHAGFIVNNGFATAADYLTVIEYAKRKVKENYNVELIEEIEILK